MSAKTKPAKSRAKPAAKKAGSKPEKSSAKKALTEVALIQDSAAGSFVLSAGTETAELRLEAIEAGVTADQLSVPISPDKTPRDDRMFDDPKQAGETYWLPRYSLAEEVVDGARQYRIKFSSDGDIWRLELTLQRIAAPQVESKATPQNVLAHGIIVELSFEVGGGTRRSLVFDEIGAPDELVLARLTLSNLADRDQVLGALREPASNAILTVRRTIRVAIEETQRENQALRPLPGVLIPIDRLRPAPDRIVVDRLRPGALPKPVIVYKGMHQKVIRGVKFNQHTLATTNWKKFQTALFKAAPNLPPCGNNRNASRTWVEVLDSQTNRRIGHYCAFKTPQNLAQIPIMVKAGGTQPKAVRLQLHDRQTNKKVLSDPVEIKQPQPPKKTYRVIDASVDYKLAQQPFSFSPVLHPYVYDLDGLGEPGSAPPGALARQRHTFGERTHSYFQDTRFRTLIYKLPDEMRLKRYSGEYRPPLMTLTVSQPGSSTDSAQAALDYVVAPYTDPARLEDARAVLGDRLNLDPDDIQFQQLIPKKVTCTIRRPSGSGLLNEERVATPRIVEEPFADRLLMPLEEFQLAFEMMRGQTAGSVGGTVLAEIEGWDDETIPIGFNFGELTEEAYDLALFVGGTDLLIKLSNPIESPLALKNAKLTLIQEDREAEISLADTEEKLTLAPGEEREFSAPLPTGFDVSPMTARPSAGIEIETDAEGLLNAILDTTTLEYFRTITVEAIPSSFRVPEDDPGKQVIAIVVAFESGSTLVLREIELSGTVRIDYPFTDIMLRKAVPNTFRYTRRLVRANGEQDELEAREAQDDHIFITGNI